MTLAGTRPPTVDEWEKYELHHRSRMSTKPGITGMWQVSGRSDITDFEEVVRLDTEYIEHWTMGEIFEISPIKGYRHYFYGSKEETLELLYQKLTGNYPGIQIAGMYSPPFRPMAEEEDKAIVERINETKPDFVWVGLGAPKQEKWMAAHQGKIDGLMLGVGAGFDYYAGNIQRAPQWMQKHNLEWVYRLVQDPKRLFKRYWSTNTKFIWNAMIRGK